MSYDPKTDNKPDVEYKGPERRYNMDADTRTVLGEIATSVKLLKQEVTGQFNLLEHKVEQIDQKVEQRLVDHRSISDTQYDNIDKILEQRRMDDMQRHRDLIDSFNRQTLMLKEHYQEDRKNQSIINCDTQEALGKVKSAITELQNAPAHKDASIYRKVRDIVIAVAATTIVVAAITWITTTIDTQIDAVQALNHPVATPPAMQTTGAPR